jgi:hypothetical protein
MTDLRQEIERILSPAVDARAPYAKQTVLRKDVHDPLWVVAVGGDHPDFWASEDMLEVV